MTLETGRIQERISQAERDLAEVAEQVALGEIDEETAERLRQRYEAERATLAEQLAGATDGESPAPLVPSLITGRRLVGAAVLAVAAAVLAFGVVKAVGEPAAEGVASDVVTGQGVNLDDITNEQLEVVIAENPDIAPMRLALADRYFGEGDFSNALNHYMYALETLEVKDPSALANVGWMTYLSGVPDVAASFVEESLEIQPDGGIAFWYIANIRFYGLGDAAGALEPLQQLLAYEELPDQIKSQAEQLLAEVEAAL
ncbi:MAG: hypothetical protein QNL12_08025 [Acidimicrobiia bacterium]|nr:hypothetical protein [Acidimicrobiia bacterium]MDX2467246.1 hypothetical protein [Acidimicrobiia bacterium]